MIARWFAPSPPAMPEISGIVQRLEPSPALGALLLVPLVGFLFFALIARKGSRNEGLLRKLGLALSFGTLALVIWQSVSLYGLPDDGRHLYWHGWQMARAGSVHFDFALALDSLSAAASLVVTLLLVLASLNATSTRHFACIYLGAFSALLFVLANGFVPMLLGLQGMGLALFWMSGSLPSLATRAFALQQLAVASLLAGALVLLWGLGGRWLADGIYQPDLQARFVALPTGGSSEEPITTSPGDPALLSFTAWPGALLHLDYAPFDSSPFVRRPIEPGRHSVRIESGPTEPWYEVNWFVTEAGKETTIAPIGPSFGFREIRDQLGFFDETARATLGDVLAGKKLFGLRLVILACLFFCVPIAAMLTQLVAFARHRESLPGYAIAAAVLGTSAIYLLSRLWFLFALTQASTLIILGLVAACLLGAWLGWRKEETRCSA